MSESVTTQEFDVTMIGAKQIQVVFENLTPEWCLRAAREGLRLRAILNAQMAANPLSEAE
jgi:hypothetical protein